MVFEFISNYFIIFILLAGERLLQISTDYKWANQAIPLFGFDLYVVVLTTTCMLLKKLRVMI
jgi:hypothetical protein